MKVTDAVEKLPYVDRSRMGAMGWSYGGYMMMWFEGHTDRFKAIASMMGLYDTRSFYGGTEELWFPEWEFKGTPWERPELYDKFSPSRHVAKWQTPTLVIHGANDFRVIDALHTVGAFLHHPAATHRHIRISHRSETFGFPIGVLQKIKASDLVGAVVGTISGTDAAVVNHVVESLGAMRGCGHRTDHLARCILAVHARNRRVESLGIFGRSFEVAVHPQPVHLSAAQYLVLTDDRNIVFGLAGNDARVAADARAQIDRHPPRVAGILIFGVERSIGVNFVLVPMRKIRFLSILVQRSRPHQIPATHIVVELGRGERIAIAKLANFDPRSGP